MTNDESIALIRNFLEACVRADPNEFAGYFAEDAVWWNSPWAAIEGRDAIRETLRRGAEKMTALPWEILHIVAAADVVMTERIDHFLFEGRRIRVRAWAFLSCAKEKSPPGAITGICASLKRKYRMLGNP